MFLIQESFKTLKNGPECWETKARALSLGDAEMVLDWLKKFHKKIQIPWMVTFRISEE